MIADLGLLLLRQIKTQNFREQTNLRMIPIILGRKSINSQLPRADESSLMRLIIVILLEYTNEKQMYIVHSYSPTIMEYTDTEKKMSEKKIMSNCLIRMKNSE